VKQSSFLLLAWLCLASCSSNTPPATHSGRNVAIAIPSATPAASSCRPAESYHPSPPPPSLQPTLPAIPATVSPPIRIGDAFTVRGAMHHLRSRVHADEVNGKRLTIVGYIVKTNYNDAPTCAVHRTGKADPANCVAPIPTFWIADEMGETSAMMSVMGWASNFAQLFSLIEAIDRAPKGKERDVALNDEFWGNVLPNPMPNVGAKVKVSGMYGVTFTKASAGIAANPKRGVLTAETIEYLEPPVEKAYLPGMKRKQ
jgi:hypothetical protein